MKIPVKSIILFISLFLFNPLCFLFAQSGRTIPSATENIIMPELIDPPVIDGDLSEWKYNAYHDGLWDIFRVLNSSWYNPSRNRLTDHGQEPLPELDLQARYYFAWDDDYIYLGAEVTDNRNDVSDPAHEEHRWYYKDCVCWFWEAPRDTIPESFGQGDNAFCFVIDTCYPGYGAWWRHGDAISSYIEEPLPSNSVDYKINMDPGVWGNTSDFVLEARINMKSTFGKSDPQWKSPSENDIYSVQIVHTDPDGGDYGGHLIIYGTGDNDRTWKKVILGRPVTLPLRKPD